MKRLGLAVLVLAGIVAIGLGWIVLGPGPMSFAGGSQRAITAEPVIRWLQPWILPSFRLAARRSRYTGR